MKKKLKDTTITITEKDFRVVWNDMVNNCSSFTQEDVHPIPDYLWDNLVYMSKPLPLEVEILQEKLEQVTANLSGLVSAKISCEVEWNGKVQELQEKLRIAVEALESVALTDGDIEKICEEALQKLKGDK